MTAQHFCLCITPLITLVTVFHVNKKMENVLPQCYDIWLLHEAAFQFGALLKYRLGRHVLIKTIQL